MPGYQDTLISTFKGRSSDGPSSQTTKSFRYRFIHLLVLTVNHSMTYVARLCLSESWSLDMEGGLNHEWPGGRHFFFLFTFEKH